MMLETGKAAYEFRAIIQERETGGPPQGENRDYIW